ncbi:MAG: hypothetical protein FWD22_04685 [Treponema sp.]|nr:hypothetical protein [Treponema sp.]
MKIKVAFLVLTAAALILVGCAGIPDNRDSLAEHDPDSWVARFGSSDFVPQDDDEDSITMLRVNNRPVRTMRMTAGRTKGAIRPDDEINALITQYRASLTANPNDFDTCVMLAGLYIDRGGPGDAAEAIKYSDMALALNKDDPYALYIRGLSYYESGNNNDKAVADLQALMQINLQSVKGAYYLMGIIYSKDWEQLRAANRPVEAAAKLNASIDAFEKVAIFDPDFADVQEILKVLYSRRTPN